MSAQTRPRELLGALAAVGMFDLLAACGPIAPQATTSDTGGTDDTTAPDVTGDQPTTGASDPTTPDPTAPDPTAPDPTAPPPECDDDEDCGELYCGYCEQGLCREGAGCCDDGGAAARPDMQRWRCGPSYECYDDSECDEGFECEFNECIPGVTTTLPPCAPLEFTLQQWNLGVTPGAFVLADFDLDGDLDLAAAQPSVAQIQIALNDGAGGFTLAGAFGVGAPLDALVIAAGDFDDDLDDDDLAVLRRDAAGGLVLLFGQDAVFTVQPPLPTPPAPIHLLPTGAGLITFSTGEVTMRELPFLDQEMFLLAETLDHRAHLANFDSVSGFGIGLVGTLPADPTVVGTWVIKDEEQLEPLVFIDPHVEHAITLVADIDQTVQRTKDNRSALILARTLDDHGEIEVWAGISGPGTFAPPIRFTTSVPITGGDGFDLDAPGGLDILATTGQASALMVLGDATGGFMCERVVPLPAPTTTRLLVAGDLDGDTHVDLVVGDPDSGLVSVLLAP